MILLKAQNMYIRAIKICLLLIFVNQCQASPIKFCDCGYLDSSAPLVDGNLIYPWTVEVLAMDGYSKMSIHCSGTLISDRHVITAAQCLHSRNGMMRADEVTIFLPGIAKRQRSIARRVDYFFDDYHYPVNRPQDLDSAGGDIVVIAMQEPFELSDSVHPICLPSNEDILKSPYFKNRLVMSSFNMTLNSRMRQPLEAAAELISDKECYKMRSNSITSMAKWWLGMGDPKVLPASDICGLSYNLINPSHYVGSPLMWKNPRDYRYYFLGVFSRGNKLDIDSSGKFVITEPAMFTSVPRFFDNNRGVLKSDVLEFTCLRS